MDKILNELVYEYDLYLPNKQSLIMIVHNVANLNIKHSPTSYILFDRMALFVNKTQKQWHHFSQSLLNLIKDYLKNVYGIKHNDLVNYLFYIVFIHWENLIIELHKSERKIRCLILSSFDKAHALLLHDFFEYNSSKQFIFDIYDNSLSEYTSKQIDSLGYDYVIANFPIFDLKNSEFIHIDDVPTTDEVNHIILNMIQEK